MIIRLCFILLLIPSAVGAATITAATPSRADVGAAYLLAVNGDTVSIPTGSNNWATTLTVNKAVRFVGSGTNSSIGTIIGMSGSVPMFSFNTESNISQNMWLTDIQFVRGPTSSGTWMEVHGCNTNNSFMVMSNLWFNDCNGFGVFVYGAIGVMTHCRIDAAAGSIPVYIYHDNWNGHLLSAGWSDPVQYGSDQAWYIEDCNLIRASTSYAFTDAYKSARYVVRNNYVEHGWWEAHGTESANGSRGTRYIESYSNRFNGNGVSDYSHNFRSGTAIIFGNTVTNGGGAGNFCHLDAYRNYNAFVPYGQANGVNPVDHNDPANPYATGTATGGGTNSLTDSGKSWTVNQWVGYQVTRVSPVTNALAETRSGYITANTATTITTAGSIGVQYASPVFASGDSYQILRVISSFDQPGVQDISEVLYRVMSSVSVASGIATATLTSHGFAVNDYITMVGGYNTSGSSFDVALMSQVISVPDANHFTFSVAAVALPDQPALAIPGEIAKVHTPYDQIPDPCYEWGNTNLDTGAAMHFSIGIPLSIISGTNYFNSTAKPGYTPLAYPHPLLTGGDTNIPAIIQTDARGTNNVAFYYAISASHSPTSFGATNLPTGLSLSTETGVISGTPSVTGVSTVGLFATNANGFGWTNIMVDIAATPPSPYLMTTGVSPNDSVYSQNLVRTLPYTYTLCAYDYNVDTNTGGTAYYDSLYTLNTNSSMLWAFYSVPTNLIATWVPAVLARYPLIWAVQPLGEETNYSILQSTTYLYSLAVTNKPLVGPSWVNDHSDAYFAQMLALGVFTNLDIISMHDYFQVPGNGGLSYPPWPEGSYYHPWEAPTGGFSNFLGRIQWMQSFTNQLRTNYPTAPKVMLTEFGLFVSNVVDAAIEATNVTWSGIVVGLGVPEGPAGLTNSVPYSHGFYTASNTMVVWSPSMLAFLGALTNPPSGGGGFTSGSANIGTLRTFR